MLANKSTDQKGSWPGLLLMVLFIVLIYSNSFNASWHFDDYANILQNPSVHIDSLTPSAIIDTFYNKRFEDPKLQGRLYRPVANLTLALNWYHGQKNVFGYHVVNLL